MTNEPTGRWIEDRNARRTNPMAVQVGRDRPENASSATSQSGHLCLADAPDALFPNIAGDSGYGWMPISYVLHQTWRRKSFSRND